MSFQSRVTIKGQVTIPKEIRDALGLAPGEVAEFVRTGNGEVLLKRKAGGGEAARLAAIREQIASVAGSLRSGRSTAALMRDLRGDEPLR